MMILLRFGACCGLGMVLAVLLLIGLMFVDQMELVRGLVSSGEPLAGFFLLALPDTWWNALAGFPGAALNPTLRSLLTFCTALAQLGLLAGLLLYRLWYSR